MSSLPPSYMKRVDSLMAIRTKFHRTHPFFRLLADPSTGLLADSDEDPFDLRLSLIECSL